MVGLRNLLMKGGHWIDGVERMSYLEEYFLPLRSYVRMIAMKYNDSLIDRALINNICDDYDKEILDLSKTIQNLKELLNGVGN